MTARLPLLMLSLTLTVLAGCSSEHPLDAPDPVDSASVKDDGDGGTASAQASALDTRALAGRFSDGKSILELGADGVYVQSLEIEGASLDTTGTWSAVGPASLLLDPDSEAAEDTVFLAATSDELRSEDGSMTFRRIPAH